MLFSIDADLGDQIVGWVMPDNPSATPSVDVGWDADTRRLEATVYRPLLKEQGLHNHGVCGFVIDQGNCPGLAEATDVRVVESETGLLIYRRRLSIPTIARKYLRVETQLPYERYFDRILSPQFQMSYPQFETVPEETRLSVLRIGYSQSIYVAGRIYPRAIDDLARSRGFQLGIVLRDPYEELAERLLVMRWSSEKELDVAATLVGERIFAAAKSLPRVDLASVEGMRRDLPLLKGESTAIFLTNPLTRQLACLGEEEGLDSNAVAISLDYLSTLATVGLRSDAQTALEVIGAALDADAPLQAAVPAVAPVTKSVGERLREVDFCEELIGQDLQIYEAAERAFRRAGAPVKPA